MSHRREYEIAFVGLKPGVHVYEYRIEDKFFAPYGEQDLKNCIAEVKLSLERNSGFMQLHFDIDGKADVVDVTSDQFMAYSMLNRFDKDNDGLTAEEFIGHSVLELDTNKSGMVEFAEWKEAYDKSVSPEAAKQFRYQQ